MRSIKTQLCHICDQHFQTKKEIVCKACRQNQADGPATTEEVNRRRCTCLLCKKPFILYDNSKLMAFNRNGLCWRCKKRVDHRRRQNRKNGLSFTEEEMKTNNKMTMYKKTADGSSRIRCHLKRQLKLSLATPKWVNATDIIEFYLKKPKGMHVDHIIPINGNGVSGLHVLWNLQYMQPKDNIKKSNKLF